jgi:nucleoside-diphosphate-sugar epimerase
VAPDRTVWSRGRERPAVRVLVTGGAGYIGSILTRQLLDRGHQVRLLDRLYWGIGPVADVVPQVR